MSYTITQANAFIEHIAPIIQNEAIKRNYVICSTTIAQAIIEGAAGTSSLAKNYHNHFGMKCGSSWKGASVNLKTKEEYTTGVLTTIKDNFRAYPNDEEGVKGYYDFIASKRYENLKSAISYKEFATLLKQDGYATSSTYINTLCKTVEKYDLTKYDNNIVPVHIVTRRTLKKGMRGSDVIILQKILKNEMYDIGKCGCDGIFGNDTEKALKEFQNEKGLVADGICGNKTWLMLEKYN